MVCFGKKNPMGHWKGCVFCGFGGHVFCWSLFDFWCCLKYIFITFVYFMCTCVCVGMYIPLYMEGGQKTTCSNCYSPSHTARGLNSGGLNFPANAFTHWAILPTYLRCHRTVSMFIYLLLSGWPICWWEWGTDVPTIAVLGLICGLTLRSICFMNLGNQCLLCVHSHNTLLVYCFLNECDVVFAISSK